MTEVKLTEARRAIEPFRDYRATLRIRRRDGWIVRPEVEHLDGHRLTVRFGWHITADDRADYAGEDAMMVTDPERSPLVWVASGDLQDLEMVDAGRSLLSREGK